MSDARFDTTPDCVSPAPHLIRQAKEAVPAVLNLLASEPRVKAPRPPHKIYPANKLVEKLQAEGHRADAARWAIHELIQESLLDVEGAWHPDIPRIVGGPYGSSSGPPTRRYQPSDFQGPAPFHCFLVRSTDALWDWWRTLHELTPGTEDGGRGSVTNHAVPPPKYNELLCALELVILDEPIPPQRPGRLRIRQPELLDHLQEKGITAIEAKSLIDYLIDRRVFTVDDSRFSLQNYVSLSGGDQVTDVRPLRILEGTYDSLLDFVTAEKQRNVQADRDGVSQPPGQSVLGSEVAPSAPEGDDSETALDALLDSLSDPQLEALEALHSLKAFNRNTLRNSTEVATEAAGRGTVPDQYKDAVTELKKLKLVGTKPGKNGGAWLLPRGRKAADRLFKRR